MVRFEQYFFEDDTLSTNTPPSVYAPDLDSWLQKKIWHTTPITKKRTRIKIISLPYSERLKYAPPKIKEYLQRLHNAKVDTTAPTEPVVAPPSNKPFVAAPEDVLTLYYGVKDVETFNVFTDGKLVKATNSSKKALEFEEEDMKVAVAEGVPIEAIKKYWDEEKNDWNDLETEGEEDKFDFVKFMEDGLFLVDFYTFKDSIKFSMSTEEDTTDETL